MLPDVSPNNDPAACKCLVNLFLRIIFSMAYNGLCLLGLILLMGFGRYVIDSLMNIHYCSKIWGQ